MRKLILTGIFATLLLGPLLGASEASTFEFVKNVNLTTMYANFSDRSSRITTARALLAYWRSFSNRIPRLSPAESAWVTKELNAGAERSNAVINRKEFALNYLANVSDNCVDIYEKLSSPEELTQAREAYLWVKSLNCYLAYDLQLRYLAIASLSNGHADGAFNLQGVGMWPPLIIDSIVPGVLNEHE